MLLGLTAGYFFGSIESGSEKIEVGTKDVCAANIFHYSYFSDKTFFDEAYRNIPKKPLISANTKGVLVNHHLLASNLIAETISTLATTSRVTVVLISPNHFSAGQGQIISSLYKWDTPYGILDDDCAAILNLEKQGVINIDESPFKKEHGISGIVPFIKKSLPNARIIPVIVRDTISRKDVVKFVDSLYAILSKNVLVIGSFDFSHYSPDSATQLLDAKSVSVIENFDFNKFKDITVDSISGLEITMRYLEKIGARHFNLIANTNSSQILHDPSIKEAVSYIDGSFSVDN